MNDLFKEIVEKSTYTIDYVQPNGKRNFKTISAKNQWEAVKIFTTAGIDGWTGYDFKEYEIINVEKRVY